MVAYHAQSSPSTDPSPRADSPIAQGARSTSSCTVLWGRAPLPAVRLHVAQLVLCEAVRPAAKIGDLMSVESESVPDFKKHQSNVYERRLNVGFM